MLPHSPTLTTPTRTRGFFSSRGNRGLLFTSRVKEARPPRAGPLERLLVVCSVANSPPIIPSLRLRTLSLEQFVVLSLNRFIGEILAHRNTDFTAFNICPRVTSCRIHSHCALSYHKIGG